MTGVRESSQQSSNLKDEGYIRVRYWFLVHEAATRNHSCWHISQLLRAVKRSMEISVLNSREINRN
ncbi:MULTISPECIES: hypothetical protein [Photorhabdus]|uniref:hypothetical protein n=1 Tax=Photorhabdus TaxID=29487 RepID=UPI0011C34F50|nr:hypothetical protein [Photorhabdus asymbiotica]